MAGQSLPASDRLTTLQCFIKKASGPAEPLRKPSKRTQGACASMYITVVSRVPICRMGGVAHVGKKMKGDARIGPLESLLFALRNFLGLACSIFHWHDWQRTGSSWSLKNRACHCWYTQRAALMCGSCGSSGSCPGLPPSLRGGCQTGPGRVGKACGHSGFLDPQHMNVGSQNRWEHSAAQSILP
jgi:hypothetical protein